jgi:hypothetical protein
MLMTLGRSSSGAIKIKTDGDAGLRAVNCACCGNPVFQFDACNLYEVTEEKYNEWRRGGNLTVNASYTDIPYTGTHSETIEVPPGSTYITSAQSSGDMGSGDLNDFYINYGVVEKYDWDAKTPYTPKRYMVSFYGQAWVGYAYCTGYATMQGDPNAAASWGYPEAVDCAGCFNGVMGDFSNTVHSVTIDGQSYPSCGDGVCDTAMTLTIAFTPNPPPP